MIDNYDLQTMRQNKIGFDINIIDPWISQLIICFNFKLRFLIKLIALQLDISFIFFLIEFTDIDMNICHFQGLCLIRCSTNGLYVLHAEP